MCVKHYSVNMHYILCMVYININSMYGQDLLSGSSVGGSHSCIFKLLAEFSSLMHRDWDFHVLAGCPLRAFPGFYRPSTVFGSSKALPSAEPLTVGWIYLIFPIVSPCYFISNPSAFFHHQEPCDYIGSDWIIQNNVPILSLID